MRHWHSAGRRPLRSLHQTLYICPPCRLRLFSAPAPATFRHSARLSESNAPEKTVHYHPVEPTPADHTNDKDPSPDHSESQKIEKGPDTTSDASPSQDQAREDTDQTEQNRGPLYSIRPHLTRRKLAKQHASRTNFKPTGHDAPSTSFFGAFQSLKQNHDAPVAESKSLAEAFRSPAGTPYASDGDTIQTLKEAMMSANKMSSTAKAKRKLRTRRNRFVNSPPPQTPERIEKEARKREADLQRAMKDLAKSVQTLSADQAKMRRLSVDQPPVPRLSHGLDRVLFNQGVYQLQDPHSKVYNFDPYLQKIMPVTEFDYDALSSYQTSSQDTFLNDFAKKENKKYVGSTSSMTGTLTHFHYLLSAWRKLNIGMFSRDFPDTLQSFTALNRAPNAIFLRWKNGTYAVDADKEHDGANVLMLLGRSMEKLLTMPTAEFERYRKGNSDGISAEERDKPESYHYSTQGDFVLRSQLDAYDPRLPGTGMFDLKTRAVLPIRMQADDYEAMTGYEISQHQGQYESFEREYYDMMRSTALKYSLQARMGRMDGIFVAYHNVKRIFGFQYMSLNELDRVLHGQSSRCLGNREFGLSLSLLNQIFDKATEKFPNQSLRFHFETRPAQALPFMYIFAEPMSEEEVDKIQNSQKEKIREWECALREPTSKTETEGSDDVEAASEEGVSESEQSENDSVEKADQQAASETDQDDNLWLAESDEAEITGAEASESNTSSTDGNARGDVFVEEINALLESSKSETAPGEENKPLLAMVLTVRSKVNGEAVERPEMLDLDDDWTIDYTLTEIPKTKRAWDLYDAAKKRRKNTFNKANKVDKEDPDSSGASYNEAYFQMLRELSKKGRRRRKNLDKAESDLAKVVVGQPVFEAQTGQQIKTDDVRIEGVDDYLTWLYKETGSSGEQS